MRRVSLQMLGNVKSLLRGVNAQTNLQEAQTERIYQYLQPAVLVGKPLAHLSYFKGLILRVPGVGEILYQIHVTAYQNTAG